MYYVSHDEEDVVVSSPFDVCRLSKISSRFYTTLSLFLLLSMTTVVKLMQMTSSSTLLPTLPSVRAKELERAALLFASRNDESSSSGNDDETTAAAGQTSSATKEDIPLQSSSLPNHRSSIRSPDNADQQYRVRCKAEELTALHEKECTVFGGHPPLDSSVACNTIHHYVVTTCSYLNSFIADVTAADDGIDRKLSVLEKQMALLESKLASVPCLFPEEGNAVQRKIE